MTGYFKTALLMAAMTALFVAAGGLIGGTTGAVLALVVAGVMNGMTWWGSDRAVLSMTGARLVTEQTAPDYVRVVNGLADRAGLPRPATYIIDSDQPNAFATGRDPANAAVAASTGLLQRLSQEEIAAVMAHELAHIRNRDTLIMTITATIAGAIGMLGNFAFFLGGNRDRGGGVIGSLLVMLVAPLAATVVQMAISRSREYEADRIGAEICGQPLWLASALRKIDHFAKGIDNRQAEANPALAHLFIINPLHAHARDALFSTHPSTENRIRALMAMSGGGAIPQSAPVAAPVGRSSIPRVRR